MTSYLRQTPSYQLKGSMVQMILKQNRQNPVCKGYSLNSRQMAMYQVSVSKGVYCITNVGVLLNAIDFLKGAFSINAQCEG